MKVNIEIYKILPIIIFILGFIYGLFTPLNIFSGIDLSTANFLPKCSFFGILFNNLKVVFTNILGGVFLVPIIYNLVVNGFALAIQFKALALLENWFFVLVTTLPHGIFEIPAILISAIAGFKIPYEVTLYLLDKKEKPITNEDIKEFLKLSLISIILIVIAAFVEVYITPKIANYILT
ncbi:stage II sporulation protein M [Methanocaldococcus indicus]|uniref:stage II sporulation protein M n=1 Tax=Methanocaldococcus indicus TaxID=213231 RepID=UPI003C6D5C19